MCITAPCTCLAGLCCSGISNCCCQNQREPAKSGAESRLPYLFILILSGVFAAFMALYGEKEWDLTLTKIECPGCDGNGSVFRVSFCLFLFELFHVLIIGVGGVSFHWQFLGIKFLIYIGLIIITFFYGTKTYSNYAQFVRFFPAPIYLIIQILLIIAHTYELNDTLQYKGENGAKWAYIVLVGGSISLYVVSLVLIGLFYWWYGGDTCHTHNTFISITLILVVLCGLISGFAGRGNFFVSSVVATYLTFLAFSGLQASNWCNKLHSEKNKTITLWIGVCFALVALCYAALRSNWLNIFFANESETSDGKSHEKEKLSKKDSLAKDIEKGGDEEILGVIDNPPQRESSDEEEAVEEHKPTKREYSLSIEEAKDPNTTNESKNETSISIKKQALYFHVIMMFAAAYMSMLLTNWGTAKGNSIATTGKESTWVNFITQWVTFGLFIWTMLAPLFCPQRFED